MSLRLRDVLDAAGIKHAELARVCGVSGATVSLLLSRRQWPRRKELAQQLREQITEFLTSRGLSAADVFKKAPTRANAPEPVTPAKPNENHNEDPDMLLRKHSLTPSARLHFRLSRDPFTDCREPADVFLSPDARYVREAMWSVCRHGGFLAVIGESGAGKSTLREELVERLQHESAGTVLIQPYVLAMEDKDSVGKTLRSQHIAEAIVRAVAPLAKTMSSPEARFRQLHEVLRDSHRTGARHVLLIEEAHCLPVPTLKHLKRYLELKDGMKPLLSVILLGQPELALKLNEQDPGVREVVQRIELVPLAPLDQHLEAYLQHRFQRVGAKLGDVIDESGIEALRARLTPAQGRQRGSLLYPLAVHNALAAAMNTAAELGAPKVTRGAFGGAA
jgi:type II secretory pathway predicted ATPase ExeA